MSSPLRAVVLGQSFAAKVQLPALRWAGGVEVVGLAGADAVKARATARAHGIEHATGDWRELLALDPDLVVVSTPVHLHREMALACLAETRAAVLCEKPFALDADEARELVAAGEGRAAWVDHQLRFSPHLRRLRELVRAGALGEAWHASVRLDAVAPDLLERPWRWWYDADRGGGMLGALGSHLVDLLRFLLEREVEAVRCHLATFVPRRADARGVEHQVTADEHVSLDLRFAGGLLASVSTSAAVANPGRPGALDLQLTGRDGILRVEEGTRLLSGDRTGLEPLAVEPPLPTCADYGMEHDYGLFSRCLPLWLREVVEAVRAGRTEIDGAATFADGLATQLVLDAARRSHAEGGRWIELP